MDAVFTIGRFDDLITERFANSPEYKTFTENIDLLEEMFDPEFFIEKEIGQASVGGTIRQAWDRTGDTISGTMRAYDDVTDGGGTLLKGVADMVIAGASLVSKIISFIMRIVANIPNIIAATLRWVSRIPSQTMAMIRGDLRLYITMEDLRAFRERIFPKLEVVILSGTTLSQGDNWGTYLNPDGTGLDAGSTAPMKKGRNDVGWKGLADRMEEAYKSIAGIQYEKTIVKMNKRNVDIYFGAKSKYYQELSEITDVFNKRKSDLVKVQEWIEQKLDKTSLSQTLSSLNMKQQMKAKRTIQTISKTMTVIGNFLKYITTDLNTITKQSQKILEKQGVTPVTNEPQPVQSARKHKKQHKAEHDETT